MDMAYVRSRGDEGRWMASLLHESQELGWLKEYKLGWIVTKKAYGSKVMYRLPYVTCFTTYAEDEGAPPKSLSDLDREYMELVREHLESAPGAMHEIEIEQEVQVEPPFRIADRPYRLAFNQELVIRMGIKSLAEHPDVRAQTDSYAEQDEHHLEFMQKYATLEPDGREEQGEDSVAPRAREIAEHMFLGGGRVIACQTDTAAVVLTLGASSGPDVFRAKAAVCGDDPLVKGEQLYRRVVSGSFPKARKPRYQVIGTVIEVV